jgi:hypothetical protein
MDGDVRPGLKPWLVLSDFFRGLETPGSLRKDKSKSKGRGSEGECAVSHPSQKARRMGHPGCLWMDDGEAKANAGPSALLKSASLRMTAVKF